MDVRGAEQCLAASSSGAPVLISVWRGACSSSGAPALRMCGSG